MKYILTIFLVIIFSTQSPAQKRSLSEVTSDQLDAICTTDLDHKDVCIYYPKGEENPYSGYVKDYALNGTIVLTQYINNGKIEGSSIMYNEDGLILEERTYTKGVLMTQKRYGYCIDPYAERDNPEIFHTWKVHFQYDRNFIKNSWGQKGYGRIDDPNYLNYAPK